MTFHNKRTGILLCQPFEMDRLLGPSRKAWNQWPVIMQPKLDGERCRAVCHNGTWVLLSSSEEVIFSMPHILAELTCLFPNNGTAWPEFDGELYLHGLDFDSIHSIVSRTVNMHSEASQMEYHIFDYVSSEPQAVRTVKLSQLLSRPMKQLKRVPYFLAESVDAMMGQYDKYLEQGYEGMIVRHPFAAYERKRMTTIMKFKPKKNDTYRIIGFQEEVSKDGNPKNSLGAVICAGDDGTAFSVGSGFSAEQRANLWTIKDKLLGKDLLVHYQNLTAKNNVPRFGSVKQKEISELVCSIIG